MRVNIGFPVVRMDGRAYGHVITKLSQMGRLPHFLRYGALSTRALRAGGAPLFLKLATPPLPPQTKLNLEQNGRNRVLFLATTLLGEVGGTTG